MEFNNQYLKYNEYSKLGGKILEMSFPLFEYKAEKKVDELTFNRFRKLSPENYPKELKPCIYELIDIFSEEDNSIVSSETVGSYSVSKQSKTDIEKQKENIIKQYLSNTKIDGVFVLYRGADLYEN